MGQLIKKTKEAVDAQIKALDQSPATKPEKKPTPIQIEQALTAAWREVVPPVDLDEADVANWGKACEDPEACKGQQELADKAVELLKKDRMLDPKPTTLFF